MEGLHCLKYLLEKTDFLCKTNLKDAYFSVPQCMSSRKFVRFTWSENFYEFLCLCLGLGPAPRIFSKLLKIPIAPLTAEHSSSDISRRYSSDGKSKGSFNELRHIDFSASTSGFCHKSEKSSSETFTTNRVFTPKNRYPYHDFVTNRGKDRKGNFEMPESSFSPLNHCFGMNKTDRSDVLNCPCLLVYN